MTEKRLIQCVACGGWYGENFFSPCGNARKNSFVRRERCCKLCRLTARTREKDGSGRYRVKARNSLHKHALKFIKSGVIESVADLIRRFGWKVENMAPDIEHAFSGKCPYCRTSFASMPNGLQDLTLDIIDPLRPPHYIVNTKWICMTCNRRKSCISPDEYADNQRWTAEWMNRQEMRKTRPWYGLPLFDPVDSEMKGDFQVAKSFESLFADWLINSPADWLSAALAAVAGGATG